ncbi:MAG: glycosyltransferase family 2 protein [Candidatus Acidiferrales bacterium]
MAPSLTVIIPSKNRYDALAEALRSIALQTTLPSEIIIVDQTPGQNGPPARLLHILPTCVTLDYVWDPGISGGAAARNTAIDRAHGDIVLFLDDDVTLYPDFIERLLESYKENPGATGISGIPDNYVPPGKLFYRWTRIFTHGPFFDDRLPVYWNAAHLTKPVRVSRMTGAMMSFERYKIAGTRFDPNLVGVSDGEDVDFCVRLNGSYFVDPRCKLTHHFNKCGREEDHWVRRHARAYTYLYYRNWPQHQAAYEWLCVGWMVAALLGCLSRHSLRPLRSMLAGRTEGMGCVPSRNFAVPSSATPAATREKSLSTPLSISRFRLR